MGLYQSLDGIGQLCEEYNALFVVDTVATIGQMEVGMDKHKIDAVFANSAKGLSGIVGLAPVSFSPKAMKKIRERSTPPTIFYTDILRQGKVWNLEKVEIRELSRLGGTEVFHLPACKDALKIEHYILHKYQVTVSPGFGHTVGKAVRLGFFGKIATVPDVQKVMKLVKEAIESDETNL